MTIKLRVKGFLYGLLVRTARRLTPRQPTETPESRALKNALVEAFSDKRVIEARNYQENLERACELVEARQMAGAGPWLPEGSRVALAEHPTLSGVKVREANPIVSQGAFGDVELALQNVEWRREINLSWMEFSRWGIQQIMLISRLYFIKNPLIRRVIQIASTYVFGRGVEVTSDDEDANEVLQEFFERNARTLGPIALTEAEEQKYYDGNLFWIFFPDTDNTGSVDVRTIDATEVLDIITDPDDADTPWLYRRLWTERNFDSANGQVSTQTKEAWYPAIGYEPKAKPDRIGSFPVMWDTPIYHRKCGKVSKWRFGCPIIYPALDWAKEARRFLEACTTVQKALAQYSMTVTTKGGQQAIEGLKQQLETTIGPQAPIWDTNPPAVAGATFVSGTGTKVSPFQQRGVGANPEEVRQLKLMVCMVVGVPETFMADVSTGNLATATTLDRPTELTFLAKQDAWREDLAVIGKYVLGVSKAAPSGKLREALRRREMSQRDIAGLVIRERERRLVDGQMRYVTVLEAKAAKPAQPAAINVMVTFPAIREGDMLQIVQAIVQALTLGDKMGGVHGIDERAGIFALMKALPGIDNAEELIEAMYPEKAYKDIIDRTEEEDEPPPPTPPAAAPGQVTPAPAAAGPPADSTEPQASNKESLVSAATMLSQVGRRLLERSGRPQQPTPVNVKIETPRAARRSQVVHRDKDGRIERIEEVDDGQ